MIVESCRVNAGYVHGMATNKQPMIIMGKIPILKSGPNAGKPNCSKIKTEETCNAPKYRKACEPVMVKDKFSKCGFAK